MWLLNYHICIFKQIGCNTLRAMKSCILRQFDSRVRTVRWHAILLKHSSEVNNAN